VTHRKELFTSLASLYQTYAPGQSQALAECMARVADTEALTAMLLRLAAAEDTNQNLVALQVAFDIVDSLPPAVVERVSLAVRLGAQDNASASVARVLSVLGGEAPVKLMKEFLKTNSK
ncbi:hypothetical protein KIPB_016195, partial [Kipferlia bialata]